MPVALLWIAGGAVAGYVFDQAGDAAEQAGNASTKLAAGALAGAAAYWLLRRA